MMYKGIHASSKQCDTREISAMGKFFSINHMNTTNITLSPLPPPIHHNHHQHECHLYKYHRYRPPPPLLQKYGNGMNECDNKTHCTNESNMLTIKRIQTGPTRLKYLPCVHFTTLHCTVHYMYVFQMILLR